MAADRPRYDVTIVGAGIVGICCALRLQQDGHRVTLIDPKPPGTATSFGNAGIIGTGAIMPYSTPGLWRQIPKMLLDPLSPLMLRWQPRRGLYGFSPPAAAGIVSKESRRRWHRWSWSPTRPIRP